MKAISKWLTAQTLFVGLLYASSAGAAEHYFNFSFSGSGVNGAGAPVTESGSGILGGVAIGNGDYFINHIDGTANGHALSLLPTATLYTGGCPTALSPVMRSAISLAIVYLRKASLNL